MWSKEKTIEWKELGSRGKYKKRFVNKKIRVLKKIPILIKEVQTTIELKDLRMKR